MTQPDSDLGLDLTDCPIVLIAAAWDITTLMLDRVAPDQQLRLARIRQAYLDEIERRRPGYFDRLLTDPQGRAVDLVRRMR